MAVAPQIIERDAQKIAAETKAWYESISGKPLQPAQPEMLLINTMAYREAILRSAIQDGFVQNLVEFSRAPVLDYLGELVGVTRLPAEPAKTTLRFNNPGSFPSWGPISVPLGTRVQSADGNVVFETTEDAIIPAEFLASYVDIPAEAAEPGTQGNGYQEGDISVLLDGLDDPQPTVANVSVTSGGSAAESDDALRARIKLAPASFSVAGPRGAYRYWTFTASPDIVDVAITNPVPGTVRVFPLVSGGVETPSEILADVLAILDDEKVRPLSDTVEVESPTVIGEAIHVDLTRRVGFDEGTVIAAVEANLQALADDRRKNLGKDLLKNQIIAACLRVEGVYEVVVSSPAADVIAGETEVISISSLSAEVIATVNE